MRSVSQSEKPITEPSRRATPLGDLAAAMISVALAAYLIGLALTVAVNTGSGSSTLLRTLKTRLFSPWLVPLWLDLGFDHRLTYGQPDDADHTLLLGRFGEEPAIRMPSGRGERAARWERLARSMVVAENEPHRQGLLPATVAAGFFDDLACEDVTLAVVRAGLPDIGQAAAAEEAVYEARVRRIAGEIQLIKQEQRAEVAPARQAFPDPSPSSGKPSS
jgi:hypothetical protein